MSAVPELPEPLDLPELARLVVGGRVVAEYVDGAALPAELSPRPFLHPVRTSGGAVVSAACPEDHRWHLGVGVAVQDVGGANLWGGRTYVRDQGYVWRGDHGTERHTGFSLREPDAFTAGLDWLDRDGHLLLHEVREVRATALAADAVRADVAPAWRLELAFTLVNGRDAAVDLGSPATNGRPGGGYGGFFWRLPPIEAPRVRTEEAEGEDGVHGTVSRWLALSGVVAGRPVTLMATQPADRPPDPWFVRLAGYPGFGVSLATDRPVRVPGGGRIRRSVQVLVVDGTPEPELLWEELSAADRRERMQP